MLKKPTLIVSESICRNNIEKMYSKAFGSGTVIRPHFKTHQNSTIGKWYKEAGVNKITVSSVSMALMFAEQGWDDIFIAFPLNINEIEDIHALSRRIKVGVLVSCPDSAQAIVNHIESKVDVYLKIDVGTYRTGFLPEDIDAISKSIDCISKNKFLCFKGFAAHAGHTYNALSHDEIRSIYRIGIDSLLKLKKHFIKNFPDIIISWGDTPSCSIINNFSDVDEIRPGNFVFYDLMQLNLKVCKPDEIALIIACPVVAKHSDRNEIVIYGGAVHLSKDNITINGKSIFGMLVKLHNDLKWEFFNEPIYVDRISQEHGIIKVNAEVFNNIKIGDFIGIVPVHSCLAVDLIKEFHFIQ